MILSAVREIRNKQPRIGGKKLYIMLNKSGIKIGRDKLFNLLRDNNMLIKIKKKYVRTTNSYHRFRKYPNLIKELNITGPNQVWVSDITYIDTFEGFCYLALITDAYSRKIVGYDLSDSLDAEGCQRALKMALEGLREPYKLIHHSDRGIQYCSYEYVRILESRNVRISMTEVDHASENALAERVNGILKLEFMLGEKLPSKQVAKELTVEAITTYNELRPHMSINYEIPTQRHGK